MTFSNGKLLDALQLFSHPGLKMTFIQKHTGFNSFLAVSLNPSHVLIKATAYQGNKFRNPVTLYILIWWFGAFWLVGVFWGVFLCFICLFCSAGYCWLQILCLDTANFCVLRHHASDSSLEELQLCTHTHEQVCEYVSTVALKTVMFL